MLLAMNRFSLALAWCVSEIPETYKMAGRLAPKLSPQTFLFDHAANMRRRPTANDTIHRE